MGVTQIAADTLETLEKKVVLMYIRMKVVEVVEVEQQLIQHSFQKVSELLKVGLSMTILRPAMLN
jgi:hypothetical protein